LSHAPLFQVLLALQNNERGEVQLPGLDVGEMAHAWAIAKFDLSLSIAERESGLRLTWEYNTALFEAGTIQRMAGHFARLIDVLAEQPHESVHAAPMLDEQEGRQVLLDFNATQRDYPQAQ